jgi:hypothetical protein
MIQGFLPTIAVAMIGLVSARVGDRLRNPLIRRKPCDDTNAWSYKAQGEQQQSTWRPVQVPHPCA